MIKFISSTVSIALIVFHSSIAFAQDTWIEKASGHSVDVTTNKLVKAIEGAGATLFAVIDHKAGAEKAGLKMNGAKVVIFGNPKLGTPIMNANPKAALDLPIKVLVWKQDGKVLLGALSPSSFSQRYNLSGVDPQLAKMNDALNKLMAKAAE